VYSSASFATSVAISSGVLLLSTEHTIDYA
jgi:hypothetical protein